MTGVSSRMPKRVAALVCFLATMLLAWPALGGAFLVNPNSDQYIAGYSFREFAARSLREGHGFPTWNPFQFGGMPYVAAMHGDIFYPTFLLRMLLPTDIAMTWGFIIHTALAGFFTYGFLRASGVRFPSAIIGGLAYLLSGAVASYPSPGHDGKLFVSAMLPAALWALVRGLRDGRRSAWGALSIVVGLAVLSPHPQLLQYMLLVCGGFALFAVIRPYALHPGLTTPTLADRDRSRAQPGKGTLARFLPLGTALLAVLLGGAIGAVQYLPVMEYVPWSPRSGGKGYAYATSFSFPLEETINVYLPQFSGILDKYWGRNGIHLHSEYAGVVVLVLALAAFGGGLANRHRPHAWFWLGTLIVSLLWAWGSATPFYQLVYAVVPGSKFFRAPSTMLFVSAFSTAVLAAFGAERALAGRMSIGYAASWSAFASLVVLLAVTGGFTNIGMSLMGDERADEVLANAGNVTAGAWRSAAFVIAALTVMLGVAARNRLTPTVAGWLLAALLAADLWSIERHYWRFSPRAATLFADDAIIRFLQSQPRPARVIAVALSENFAAHDPFLTGDGLMHHEIRGVLGYHGNELGRYQQLYGKSEGMRSVANPNFWSLTNARFLYTNTAQSPLEGAELVAGPVRNAAGTMTYLYELPGDHPAAWVAPLMVKLDDATTKATVLNPLFDVKRVAIFDSSATIPSKPVNSPLPAAVSFAVDVSRYDPGAIDLTLQDGAPAGSALVVAENFYPGWRAVVDGKPAKVGRANFTSIGVDLPAGARRVELRFESPRARTGGIITLLATGTALLWLVAGLFYDRRRSALAPAGAAA
ncbi:MAG TPA: hypothetical protein VE869_13050 [Gemmatimonas sp.]|nr:hypothetical protein [Gemmatimonas sp.]